MQWWKPVCRHHLLTETPSCEAEHMAAPTKPCDVKKVLANSEPSTHGPIRNRRMSANYVRSWGYSRPKVLGMSISPWTRFRHWTVLA
jgi:hypothetical protein